MRACSPACLERGIGCEHHQPTPKQESNLATLRRGVTALPLQQLQGLNKPMVYRMNGEPPQALAPISRPLPHTMPTTLSNDNVLLRNSNLWRNHDQYRTRYTNSGTQTQLPPSGPPLPSPPRGRLNQCPPSRPSAPTPDSMRFGRNTFPLSSQSEHTHLQGQESVSFPTPPHSCSSSSSTSAHDLVSAPGAPGPIFRSISRATNDNIKSHISSVIHVDNHEQHSQQQTCAVSAAPAAPPVPAQAHHDQRGGGEGGGREVAFTLPFKKRRHIDSSASNTCSGRSVSSASSLSFPSSPSSRTPSFSVEPTGSDCGRNSSNSRNSNTSSDRSISAQYAASSPLLPSYPPTPLINLNYLPSPSPSPSLPPSPLPPAAAIAAPDETSAIDENADTSITHSSSCMFMNCKGSSNSESKAHSPAAGESREQQRQKRQKRQNRRQEEIEEEEEEEEEKQCLQKQSVRIPVERKKTTSQEPSTTSLAFSTTSKTKRITSFKDSSGGSSSSSSSSSSSTLTTTTTSISSRALCIQSKKSEPPAPILAEAVAAEIDVAAAASAAAITEATATKKKALRSRSKKVMVGEIAATAAISSKGAGKATAEVAGPAALGRRHSCSQVENTSSSTTTTTTATVPKKKKRSRAKTSSSSSSSFTSSLSTSMASSTVATSTASLTARRVSHRHSNRGGTRDGDGGGGLDALELEEAIDDDGTVWRVGDLGFIQYHIYPIWPLVVRGLKLTTDGETIACIDFFGGTITSVESALSDLSRYETMFPKLFSLSISEMYESAIVDSMVAFRAHHELSEGGFLERCGLVKTKDREAFRDFLEETDKGNAMVEWKRLNRLFAADNNRVQVED